MAGETQAQDATRTRPDPLRPGQTRHTTADDRPERGQAGGGERNSGTSDPAAPSAGPLSELLLEACDPDVPTRAVALRTLTRMVQTGDPEAVQAQEKVLTVGC